MVFKGMLPLCYGKKMSPLSVHLRSQCWVTCVGLKNAFPRTLSEQIPTTKRLGSSWMLVMSPNSPLMKYKPVSTPGTYQMVHHNGKDWIVFNCSFTHQGASLNEHLSPGPTLGSTTWCAAPLQWVAIKKGMFHLVRLLPEDKPFLQVLWKNIDCSTSPEIYEWQVLSFGTTRSLCCAIFVLQKHVL